MNIQQQLFALAESEYRSFSAKLMPTVPFEKVIGVRTPLLKKLAKELNEEEVRAFMKQLPHIYYEENNLHAFLIMRIREFEPCLEAVEAFLPFVDNWATCDGLAPKALGKEPQRLLERVRLWLASEHTYTIRYGIGTLQRFFLDEGFCTEYAELVAAVSSEEYYVRMMAAWYFATALAKQYEAILPFLERGLPDRWTHNKAIQKAIESYRITPEQKTYLRSLKRK